MWRRQGYTSARNAAQWYWDNNIQPALDQFREAFGSPTIRVTAAQVYERTGEDGKVWVCSRLSPCSPHVYIDDNKSICQEARRTNARVVEVNKRTGVLGFVDDLQQLRAQINFTTVSVCIRPSNCRYTAICHIARAARVLPAAH